MVCGRFSSEAKQVARKREEIKVCDYLVLKENLEKTILFGFRFAKQTNFLFSVY